MIDQERIIDLIPQRHPIVLVDMLEQADENITRSRYKIDKQSILCKNEVFSESGLLENVAQTAAAGIGYQCKIKKISIPIGFIASIKDIKILSLPKVEDEILTEVKVINQIMNISVIHGFVTLNGLEILSCEMQIIIQN